MNVAGASKRPRPRVRDAVSIDLDAEADAGSRKLSTSASPLNKSTFDRTRSLTEQTFDDEDDFFNRAMRRRGMSKTTSLDPTDLDMALSYDDQTVGKDEDTDQQSDSSAHNGYKPRRARAYHAAWARTESAPSKRVRRSRSSSTSTEDGEDALTFGHGTEGSPSTRDQTGPKRKRKIQEVDSPELTPPPEIEQEKLQEIAKTIEQHLGDGKQFNLEDEEDESFSAAVHDEKFIAQLDPDLARLVSGSRAVDVRRTLRERETLRRREDEEQRRTEQITAIRRRAEPPREKVCVEISDSDDDDRPSVMGSIGTRAQARNVTTRSRARGSSSPAFEIVSITQAAPSASTSRAPSNSTPATETSHLDVGSAASEEPSQVHEETEVEEARIGIVMKGGQSGELHVRVQVRPKTQVKKLLDHFIVTHRAAIPQNRTSKVRIRFDGETLKDSDTMESIGIEDDEQLDVIW